MAEISNFEFEILELINSHRAKIKRSPLSFHAPIQEVSYIHSNNIANGAVPFGHQGFAKRANELIQKLNGSAASENVAMGQESALQVVQSWIESDGHRKNIEGDYNLTGISVVKNSSGEHVFTQIFIKAPNPEPSFENNSSNDNHIEETSVNLNYSLLQIINKHRTDQHLSPLQINPHIQVAATQHAQNMADGNIPFSHEGFQERAKVLLEKTNGKSVAENVAFGQDNLELITQSWLDSTGHRNNIEGDYNLTGIGIAKAADNSIYYCQIFIKK